MTARSRAMPSRWSPLALLATWGGSGYLPRMPGTWGSLAALPCAALIHWLGGGVALAVAALLVTALGIWVAHRYMALRGGDDPQEVVIDEVAGQWIALAPLALDPLAYLVGFAAFRLFDTLKPWPIRWFEGLPGGWGVVMDDVVAGVFAGVLCYLGLTLAGWM